MVTKSKYLSMKEVLHIVIFARRVEWFTALYLMAFLLQSNTVKILLYIAVKFGILVCYYAYQLYIKVKIKHLYFNKTFDRKGKK